MHVIDSIVNDSSMHVSFSDRRRMHNSPII